MTTQTTPLETFKEHAPKIAAQLEIAVLEKQHDEAWDEFQKAEKSIQPIKDRWYQIHTQLQRAKLKAEIAAELSTQPEKEGK